MCKGLHNVQRPSLLRLQWSASCLVQPQFDWDSPVDRGEVSMPRARRSGAEEFIYLAVDATGRLVKVGFSRTPLARIKALTAFCPQAETLRTRHALEVPRTGSLTIVKTWTAGINGGLCMERIVHERLHRHCDREGEWFAILPEKASRIISLAVTKFTRIWKRNGRWNDATPLPTFDELLAMRERGEEWPLPLRPSLEQVG